MTGPGQETWEELELEGYHITEADDSGTVRYYLFICETHEWYILKEDTTSPVKSYRYAQGRDNYVDAWTNRALLTYNYFDIAFA